ncbi:MAG TPA: bifunctional hydroxymethylpyrimidine kinase/phosphomethylpyrimidine kinase [Pyrinomonadaceae bacterium]|jgi:hydroxymethylpyrimidine kinase/phosphomethylpyrimidine kinase|nr:bifunctional hydroxymethylpyrimidine kinase/phosphomethylpyrimidine kinase [Pyrinomonadaceae bacterium]
MSFSKIPMRALTIAGFDPSGGAGVLADVRTFAAFGLEAAAVITSITFQNRSNVFGAEHQSGEAVRAQVMPLLEDGGIVCSKTGMLPTREVVLKVARLFRETDLPRPVVDPVILSSSGQRLMAETALATLIRELLPLAQLITPNVPEAETLTGTRITSESDMRRAASLIREQGARAVLIKGGHLGRPEAEGRRQEAVGSGQWAEEDEAIDVLDNGGKVTVFRERWISGGELHGSGCILSAAIAAGLGKGMRLEDSVSAAKRFVFDAINEAGNGS